MANYTLVPVDGNQIRDQFGDAVFDKLVPYQPHLFDNIMWGSDLLSLIHISEPTRRS